MEQNFKIAVPEGCTANIEKKDNFVIVTFEPKEWKPKDGDVCVSRKDSIFIFDGNGSRKTSLHFALFKDGSTTYSGALNGDDTGYRYATEEEKQLLFDALAKEGKRWNAEKKRIEDLPRWRAKLGDFYFYVNDMLGVGEHAETKDCIDNSLYTSGNYFKTREAAERAAEKIRKILKESNAE